MTNSPGENYWFSKDACYWYALRNVNKFKAIKKCHRIKRFWCATDKRLLWKVFCMRCQDTLHCIFVPKIIWVKILMFLIMPIYKDKWNWFRWSVAFILMGTGHLKWSTFVWKQFPWLFILGCEYWVRLSILNKRFWEEPISKKWFNSSKRKTFIHVQCIPDSASFTVHSTLTIISY